MTFMNKPDFAGFVNHHLQGALFPVNIFYPPDRIISKPCARENKGRTDSHLPGNNNGIKEALKYFDEQHNNVIKITVPGGTGLLFSVYE